MLTTVFKDKLPKGISYPLPLEFLRDTLGDVSQHPVALYFVYGSHWVRSTHNSCEALLHIPCDLVSAGRSRPMFRNNNQKIPSEADNCEWHLVISAMPSADRQAIQEEFAAKAAAPLIRWIIDRTPPSETTKISWSPDDKKIGVEFP